MAYFLTREEALAIQSKQIEHFVQQEGAFVRDLVASHTKPDNLQPGVPYHVVEVNRHIPRGGFIEMMIARHRREGQVVAA